MYVKNAFPPIVTEEEWALICKIHEERVIATGSNRRGNSIIIGFAMYMIFNMVSVTAVFAAGLFSNQIMNLIKTSDAIDTSVLKDLLLCAIALYAVYNVVLYIMGSKLLKKGVDIE